MIELPALALLVSKAKASVFTMEYISQFEASDIDSDDVDLRFEVDGVETGTNVSIVDECGQAAQMIRALVEALEKALAGERHWHRVASRVHEQACDSDVKIDELEKNVAELNSARQHITELEKSHVQVIQSRDHYKRMTEEGLKQLAESRTVTLPKRYSCEGYHIDEAYLQEDPEGDCYDRDEVLEALAAAGIQVIEGEQKNG